MIRCLHCSAETSNGLALCDLCRRKASADLDFIPVYFQNLARWRPGRAGSRPVPGSRVLYDGEIRASNDRISNALDETGADLVGWARKLEDDRGVELPEGDGEAAQTVAVCALLGEHLTSISTLDWAGEFMAALGRIEGWLSSLTERYVPGWYAGGCQHPIGFDEDGAVVRCESGTYVVPGLTWVTCGACGTTTYARDHLEVVLREAREWVAAPMRLAEAAVALLDTELSIPRLHKRISKWGERGRIEVMRRLDADGDPVGPKRYRLGEVLDMLSAEGATRLDGPFARKAS